MVQAHPDVTTAEGFFDYFALNLATGKQSHEFVARKPLMPDEENFKEDVIAEEFDMMDAAAVLAKGPVELPSIEPMEDKCIICEQPRSVHEQFDYCAVCYTKRKDSEFYVMEQCCHSFCIFCLREYLETLVTECNVGRLKCQEYECTNVISNELAKSVLDPLVYAKFLRYRESLEIDLNPNLFRCPGCEATLDKTALKKQK